MSLSGAVKQMLRKAIVTSLHLSGTDRLWFSRLGRQYIRAVNYHGTPPEHQQPFERQLQYLRQHFHPATTDDLQTLLQNGTWPHEKPGILLSFDDGMRTNFDFGAPLLERYGFTGWFFVMPEFLGCPASEQAAFATTHSMRPSGHYADGRYAMNREELLDLRRRGHVIGCHTLTHARMRPDLDHEQINTEIVTAKARLQDLLQDEIDTFCWVGGEEENYHPVAQQCIGQAGFRYSFLTNSAPITAHANPLSLQRTNLGTDWTIPEIAVNLCGLMDLKYREKRLRVERKLFCRETAS